MLDNLALNPCKELMLQRKRKEIRVAWTDVHKTWLYVQVFSYQILVLAFWYCFGVMLNCFLKQRLK